MVGYKDRRAVHLLAVGLLVGGCAYSDSESARLGGDYDNGDTEAWSGDYNGSDADADADADAPQSSEPEVEKRVDAIMPQGAGRYVFVSDEARDSVVVVDSETLEIYVTEVGSRPTHLVTLPDDEATRVAVINLNSDEVSVVEMTDDHAFEMTDLPVRPDTNALAPSPDGRFVIAYHDPDHAAISGTPSTDQEITILRVEKGAELAVDQSVGIHPWKVVYNEDITKAFVVTEGGINVVDLENIEDNLRADPVILFESGTYDSETADIEITPDGSLALGRITGSLELVAAPLDDGGETRVYTLPAEPTDLDIAADGSFGMVVLRAARTVAFFDLPLPEDPAADPFTYVSLGDRYAGLATISESGDQVLLHTTVTGGGGDDTRRITLMTRAEEGWEITSAVLERPIESVAMVNARDAEGEVTDAMTAIVVHAPGAGAPAEKPWGYSLVTLPSLMSKLQRLESRPGQLLLTPDGAFGFLLMPANNRTEKIDLKTLIVNPLGFSSSPTAAGYAAATDKVFVAQDHPAGRMSFIGVRDDAFKTVTGYNLNDDIEVSE